MAGWWSRWWGAVRVAAAQQNELQERLWLLDHPWEEDYLHWVGDGEDRRLHGTTPPPLNGRRYSVTGGGWCPGLAAEGRRRADPPTAAG